MHASQAKCTCTCTFFFLTWRVVFRIFELKPFLPPIVVAQKHPILGTVNSKPGYS